jgi:carboxymethylenebutenolidase
MKKSLLFSTTALREGPTAHWAGRLWPVRFEANSKPTHANRISAVMKRILFVIATISMANAVSAQDWAKAKLEKSPRHLEWVKVKQGKREVNCFVAYPEVKDKATAVVVIHEIFGLTDWVRGVADQLAEAGYIAIAPDLLSGAAPKGGGTAEFGSDDAVRAAIPSLPPDQITADLNAVLDYVSKLPACNGKVAVTGFCWGGAQTFRLATNNKNVKAAFPFYGTGPDKEEDIARINCPVYGFYGGKDARVNATIPKSTELMKKAGKTYEPVIYEDAGHGFLRAGEAPDAGSANKKARDEGWQRLKELLKKI